MNWLPQLFARRRRYDELSESIREHLDEKIADLIDRGMTSKEAEQAARRDFGNVTLIEERSREVWQWPKLASVWADLKYALRRLWKSPGFSATVILTVALGIGANTAIFTLIHAILMKSLPVADPQSLYRIGDSYRDCCFTNGLENDNGDFDIFSYDQYQHLQQVIPEFEQLAAVQSDERRISVRRGDGVAKSERSEYVSGNYFSTLGIGAFAGRVFAGPEDKPGAAPVAVLSYQAWQTEYAGDPSIVGSTFYLQGQPVSVIGIAPPSFYGDRISANPPAFWIPLSAEPLLNRASSILHQPIACWLYVVGRVRPSVATGALQEKISSNLRGWLLTQEVYTSYGFSEKISKAHVIITPAGKGIQNLQQKTNQKLYLLFAISLLILIVACANVANLMLARGVRLKIETSVRMALGSTRSRLVRQMLTESVLLGCLGGLTGLALAYLGARMILALAFPEAAHGAIDATPSLTVLGFAFVLSLGTGMIFGMIPSLISSSANPAEAMRGVNRTVGSRSSLVQNSLIILQSAFSLVLLIGMGLLLKSLQSIEHQDFGVQTSNRYVLHIDPAGAGYKPENLATLNRALELQFSAIPGMQSVGLAMYSPLDGNQWTDSVFIPGRTMSAANDNNNALLNRVSSSFLETVGQPIIRGRSFTQADNENSALVAVVNQSFAKKFFPNEDALGSRFGLYEHEDIGAYEIVGIVADAKYTDPRVDAGPMVFEPISQWQRSLKEPISITLETQTHYITSIVMNFHGTQQYLEETVHRTLSGISPNLVVINLQSLNVQLDSNFSQERLVARLTTLFGLLALSLTAVGLYGITAYQTAQRTREIGLRMAFGANRSQVIGLMMKKAFYLVGLGLVLGLPMVFIGAHYMADQLYVVKPYDPISLCAAVFVLLTATVLAGFVPAHRAAAIDPVQALRSE